MRLNEVITDYTDGIFSAMGTISGAVLPWHEDITNTILDSVYHGSVSGNKRISPIVSNMLKKDSATTLSGARVLELATMIYSINRDKWNKLYSTLSYVYDPIKNYDMTESETTSGSNSGSRNNTGTQTETHTGTQTSAQTGTQTDTHTGTVGNSETTSVQGTSSGTSADDIFGFNSSTAVHADAGTTSGTTTNSGTATSTRTDDLTDTRTDDLTDTRTDNLTDTRTDALSETTSGTNSGSRSLTRSGNIGVTTSQQMIQSERELDMWNIFYSVIFKDVDKMLTIATY